MALRSTSGQVTLARNAGGDNWGLAAARHQAAAGHSECACVPLPGHGQACRLGWAPQQLGNN